jgi:hypothetical protein
MPAWTDDVVREKITAKFNSPTTQNALKSWKLRQLQLLVDNDPRQARPIVEKHIHEFDRNECSEAIWLVLQPVGNGRLLAEFLAEFPGFMAKIDPEREDTVVELFWELLVSENVTLYCQLFHKVRGHPVTLSLIEKFAQYLLKNPVGTVPPRASLSCPSRRSRPCCCQ